MQATATILRRPGNLTTAWAGPVFCRHCVNRRQMATVSMLDDGEVLMSLWVLDRDPDTGEYIRATGFAPISTYLDDDSRFAWIHSCRRQDGPADLDQLVRDAGDLQVRRRGYLVA